jgi:hypothetical protein
MQVANIADIPELVATPRSAFSSEANRYSNICTEGFVKRE